jgi:hypothetical protein
MRRMTSTVLLIVVLAGLGAYIYFVDSKRPGGVPGPAGTIVESKEKVFPGVESDKIEEVKLTAEKDTTTLRKQEGTWKIVEPTALEADQNEPSGITSGITGLEYGRIVEENAADLATYGLTEPRFKVSFKAAGGAGGEIHLGERTATGTDVYAAKAGEKRVFLVPSFNETTFNKKTFDLRDKKVLNVKRDDIDSVEVTGAVDVALARKGTEWTVTRPLQARGDYSTVEGLLTRVTGANMTKLVEQGSGGSLAPDVLAKYGLDKPQLTVTVGGGGSKAAMAIGKEEEGSLYARDLSRPLIFTIDPATLTDLKKPADDYRNKNLFEFRSFNLARLRVVRGSDTHEFVKVPAKAAGESDKWQRTTNGGAAVDVDMTKWDDFVNKLTNLRAESFATAGGKEPDIVVAASHDEGKFERVRFGKTGADLFATRDGEPGAAKLDATNYGDTIKSFDELLKAPAPLPAAPTPAPTPAKPGS